MNAKLAKEKWGKDGKEVQVINGCCFGNKKNKADKVGYEKICGQDSWRLISDDDELYIKIIEPIGRKAKEKMKILKLLMLLFYLNLQMNLQTDIVMKAE